VFKKYLLDAIINKLTNKNDWLKILLSLHMTKVCEYCRTKILDFVIVKEFGNISVVITLRHATTIH